MIKKNVTLSKDLLERFEPYRKATGATLSAFLRMAFDAQLTKWENQRNVDAPKR